MTPATQRAIELLRQLIATPSHTRNEGATADLLAAFLEQEGVTQEPDGALCGGSHGVGD